MNIYKSDFLIIGSGLAGLSAAESAANYGKVNIIAKSDLDISNSYYAQGGIAAAIGSDDSFEFHLADTIKAGRGLCSDEAVRILVEDGYRYVSSLLEDGMPFEKKDNFPDLGLEGGHSKNRILHSNGNATGKAVVDFVNNRINKNQNISSFYGRHAFELLVKNNTCHGVYCYNTESNQTDLFIAPFTLIATGGLCSLYERNTNPDFSYGDGIALAFNAGADIESMEFIQFHPTSFHHESGATFLISEALRGEGAYLVNKNRKRIMLGKDAQAELAPRDVVSRYIFEYLRESGEKCVYLMLDHLDAEKIKDRFKNIYEDSLGFGIDITKDLVPVSPAAHYTIGGIKTDLNGRTGIVNLYSSGEAASSGVHGANRLASNSLLECIVFSKRSIEDFVLNGFSDNKVRYQEKLYTVDNSLINIYVEKRKVLSVVLNSFVGILRNDDLLARGLKQIQELKREFPFKENEYYSLSFAQNIVIAEMVFHSAKFRKESRGGHLRSDYPTERDDYQFTTIINKSNGIDQIRKNT